MEIQATKPQTLSFGISDSPVGLLAWLGEKNIGHGVVKIKMETVYFHRKHYDSPCVFILGDELCCYSCQCLFGKCD